MLIYFSFFIFFQFFDPYSSAKAYFPFQQDSGANKIVSVEAEHYSGSTRSADGHEWQLISGGGYSGGAAMQALPEDTAGYASGYAQSSPRLDYEVEFVGTGTHYLWVLGLGTSSYSDSLHVGIDGAEVGTAANINRFSPLDTLLWSNKSSSVVRTLNVGSPGVHTINVWMRESGMVVDKLVLTTNPAYSPTGTGPTESQTNGTVTVAAPSISPNGGTFSGPVTVTLATATVGAEIHYTLNGTAPTLGSAVYRQPIVLSVSAGLKAAAFLDGYTPSAVTGAGFVIGTPPPVLEPIGDKTVTEEQNISFTVTASEAGSGTPTLSADLSDLPVGAAFTASGAGTGVFSWTPQAGDAVNSPYGVTFTANGSVDPQLTDSETIFITVNAAASGSAASYTFQQDSGANKIVSVEAEHYSGSTRSADGHEWQLISGGGYSGGAAMQALPEDTAGYASGYAQSSPRLDYEVEFVGTGTHYLWVLGLGTSSYSDSLHVGIDGAEVGTAANINRFSPLDTLLWSNKSSSVVRTLNVGSPGVHTINVWMRESGMVVDKLVLTTNPAYSPTGTGPTESQTSGTVTVAAPSISPNGGTFSGPVTVTLATATVGAEIHYTLDGTAPTLGSAVYSQPFVLSASAGLKAAAFLDGYTPSAVTGAGFVIGTPPPVLEPIGDKTVTEEQNISFTVTASEAGSGTPTLSADLSDLPVGAAFTDIGRRHGCIQLDAAGRRCCEQSLRRHLHGDRIR